MNKKYSEFVFENLNKSKPTNLSILLKEEEEVDLFGDDNFDDDSKDDDSKDDDSKDDDSKDDDSGDESEDSLESSDNKDEETDTTEIDEENINNLSDQVSYMKNFFEKLKKDDGTSSVENYISSAVSSKLNVDSLDLIERFLQNHRLKNLLVEKKKEDLDKIEAEIDDLDRVLTKGSEIVDKFKKGKDIDVQSYVDAAINAYKNFDSLFAKELIVKQATINVLILNSGAQADANIREFEEVFHEELNRQFGIEYEEHALITNQYNTSAGAKSQS